jgi:hypothetical protein
VDKELRPDPVIEHYKQFVDRDKLRKNLEFTVDQRLRKLQEMAEAVEGERREPPSPDRRWEAISDCGPDRAADPIIELYKRDVDRTLLRENLRRTPEDRFQALAEMARFVEESQSVARKVGRK